MGEGEGDRWVKVIGDRRGSVVVGELGKLNIMGTNSFK